MSPQADLPRQVIFAIRSVAGIGAVPLHEPSFNGNEWLYLKDCLDSSFVSSVGRFVDRFEVEMAKFTGAKHAVAVINGTAALHISLKLAGVRSGDEVLVPALTFVATANAVVYCHASPHFVDSETLTLGVDPEKLRAYLNHNTEQRSGQCLNKSTGRVIRALIVMHTFGHPARIDLLMAIAKDFNIALIEDAAESLGSYYYGKHTGTFGLLGTLSFNGNKIITTGGGGMMLTNNDELARRAKHLTTTAKLPHKWEFRHDEIGFNYRLPNLNAALGCAQLEDLPRKLESKRELFERYKSAFSKVKGVRLIMEPPNSKSNYWLQTLLLNEENLTQRNLLLEATNEVGIMTRPAWDLMHELTPFKDFPRMDLCSAEYLARSLINIPSSPGLILEK